MTKDDGKAPPHGPGESPGSGALGPRVSAGDSEGGAHEKVAPRKPTRPDTGERNGREPCPPEVAEKLRELDHLRRTGRYASALALALALAEAHPRLARVLMDVAMTIGIWGGAPSEALPWFERALELAPGHRTTRLHRALCLARLGRHAEAVAEFDALVEGGYRKALVLHMKRAESLEVLGRHAEAERDWTLALAEDADNPWLLQQRATARTRLGRRDEALEDLTDALALQQGEHVDPELLHERGLLRAQLGDTEGARTDFQAGLAALRRGDPPELPEALRAALRALS